MFSSYCSQTGDNLGQTKNKYRNFLCIFRENFGCLLVQVMDVTGECTTRNEPYPTNSKCSSQEVTSSISACGATAITRKTSGSMH